MREMLPAALKIVAIGFFVYVGLVVIAWRFQERLAYPGPRGYLGDPSRAGLVGERVSVASFDGTVLHGWLLSPTPEPTDGQPAPALIWFSGNMETIGALAPFIRDLQPPGIAVLAVDYRGYGENAGSPSESAIYRDAEALWSYLVDRPDVDDTRIAVYGRSIGSVPALYLATHWPVRSVVLDSPFTSARDMSRVHYRFLPSFIVTLGMDNLGRAQALSAPLLVFHGARDRIAPVAMGRAVAEAGRAREVVIFDEAGHNDMYERYAARYRAKLHEFLTATLGGGGG